MILTDAEYHCLIGMPPRTQNQQIIFDCLHNLTNSNGVADIPLSSYGLVVDKQGNLQSVCAPDAPCLEMNSVLAGPIDEIARQCGFLEKLLRLEIETPLRQFIIDGFPCQDSGKPACLIQAILAGN
jgi:hypothetical protein